MLNSNLAGKWLISVEKGKTKRLTTGRSVTVPVTVLLGNLEAEIHL